MAFSKNLIILIGLLFAFALLVSSQVAASEERTKTTTVEEVKNGKTEIDQQNCLHGCRSGRCCSCVRGRCVRCCPTANETPETKN